MGASVVENFWVISERETKDIYVRVVVKHLS